MVQVHNFAPLYRRLIDCAHCKYQFLKYFRTAFSSHDVRCGLWMIFMISSDCFPTNTNQCVSEMDNHVNFMVTPCINNIQHFNYQLTPTTLKTLELLQHFKISKTAPACLGLQENRHQVHGTHASQVTICSHNTDNVMYSLYLSTFNQVCNF